MTPSEPMTVHPILEAMREVVLPNLQGGVGRVVLPGDKSDAHEGVPYHELFSYGMHQHDNYEWVWLLEGSSHINIAGSIHQLYAGDFCLLPPRTRHAEVYTPFTQPYKSIWCAYVSEALHCHICSLEPLGHLHPESRRFVPAPASMKTLLSVLDIEVKNEQPHAEPIRRQLLSSLVHLMLRALESSISADQIEGLPGSVARRVLKHLDRHYANDISLDEIGRAVGMSRNYLCSTFKREAGKTIGEALTEIRLERAKLLLLAGGLSVQEVSRAVGYSTPEYFARVFLRYEHRSPSRYGK